MVIKQWSSLCKLTVFIANVKTIKYIHEGYYFHYNNENIRNKDSSIDFLLYIYLLMDHWYVYNIRILYIYSVYLFLFLFFLRFSSTDTGISSFLHGRMKLYNNTM